MGRGRQKIGSVGAVRYDIFGNVIGERPTPAPAGAPAATVTPPSTIPPPVTSTTRTVADLDFTKRPDNTAGIVSQPQGPMQIDMLTMSPAEIADRIVKYHEKNRYSIPEEQMYRDLLQSLRHPFRPAQVPIFVDISPDTVATPAYAERIRGIADDFYRMFDAALLPQPPKPLTFRVVNDFGGAYYTLYDHSIELSSFDQDSTIVHELMHSAQGTFPRIWLTTDAWAENRTRGEAPTPFEDGHVKFYDSVDRPYTLKYYNFTQSRGGFAEVLATAFDGLDDLRYRKDKELLMVAIKAIQDTNGYYR